MYKILLFSLVAAVATSSVSAQSRVNGGLVTSVTKAPYIVQLRDINGELICGGSLIAPQYVVTAAHCFNPDKPETITVVGGANTIRDKGVQRKIIKYSQPPQYTYETSQMDVAVLKLDSPMTGPNIKAIELCDKAMKTGDSTQVYGWGKEYWNGPRSDYLRTYTAPVASQTECREQYAENVKNFPGVLLKVTSAMFCVFTRDSHACHYDSGGPVVHEGKLCGIISWANGCEYTEFPNVFTSIYAVRSFINNAMKG